MLARPVELAAWVADVLRAPTRSCAHMEIRLGIERPTSASDTGRGKCGQNRRQRRNVRMAHGSKHCPAEAIRSYISLNDSQRQALRCTGRNRTRLQDRDDDGHAPNIALKYMQSTTENTKSLYKNSRLDARGRQEQYHHETYCILAFAIVAYGQSSPNSKSRFRARDP